MSTMAGRGLGTGGGERECVCSEWCLCIALRSLRYPNVVAYEEIVLCCRLEHSRL